MLRTWSDTEARCRELRRLRKQRRNVPGQKLWRQAAT